MGWIDYPVVDKKAMDDGIFKRRLFVTRSKAVCRKHVGTSRERDCNEMILELAQEEGIGTVRSRASGTDPVTGIDGSSGSRSSRTEIYFLVDDPPESGNVEGQKDSIRSESLRHPMNLSRSVKRKKKFAAGP